MGFAESRDSFVGNRADFSLAGDGHQRKHVRGRLLLTVAVGMFVSTFLAACGGGFFTHPSLSTMYINPASATLSGNNTVELAAYGTYSDGSQSALNGSTVTWSSSDPTIATVTSPGGLVTGVSSGSATITATTVATVPGSGCQIVVTVTNGSPSLTKNCYGNSTETLTASVPVNVGASDVNRAIITTTPGSTIFQSTATISGAPAAIQFYAYANGDDTNDMTQSVTWTSSNPNVATISSGLSSGNGLATSVATGTTNITATTTNGAGQLVNSQTIVLTVQ
jgi:trimeric autotransporter adhesin